MMSGANLPAETHEAAGTMKILGIDTTSRSGSVALVEGTAVLGCLQISRALDHSEHLLPSIEYLLSRLGITASEVGGIAVSVGPGSFTGVRVGLASVRGLARSWEVPSVGVSSLEALARAAPEPPPGGWICPWIDAGRGEIYAAAYTDPSAETGPVELIAPALARPESWLASLPACPVRFVGDGARAHRELLSTSRGSPSLPGSGPWFLAPALGLLGGLRLQGPARGRARPLEPVYLRPSDAELGRRGR
jgi:tRNA threonylcarbamoyladenosine biosynthesis protein TsaB